MRELNVQMLHLHCQRPLFITMEFKKTLFVAYVMSMPATAATHIVHGTYRVLLYRPTDHRDQCSVCNGDGSTCLSGCDNKPWSSSVEDPCGVCGGNCTSAVKSGSSNNKNTVIIGAAAGGGGALLLIIAAVLVFFFVIRKRRSSSSSSYPQDVPLRENTTYSPMTSPTTTPYSNLNQSNTSMPNRNNNNGTNYANIQASSPIAPSLQH